MTGINHAVTGALVAVAVKQPVLALPAAFLSHFIIDAIPHWNYKIKDKQQKIVLMGTDLFLSLAVLAVLVESINAPKWLIISGGLLGISPDAMWLPYIIRGAKAPSNKKTPLHAARRLHSKIQWSESTKAAAIEVVWFILMWSLIFRIVQ